MNLVRGFECFTRELKLTNQMTLVAIFDILLCSSIDVYVLLLTMEVIIQVYAQLL